jgi:hypothetical protein
LVPDLDGHFTIDNRSFQEFKTSTLKPEFDVPRWGVMGAGVGRSRTADRRRWIR